MDVRGWEEWREKKLVGLEHVRKNKKKDRELSLGFITLFQTWGVSLSDSASITDIGALKSALKVHCGE